MHDPFARLIGPVNSGIAAGGAGVATANATTLNPITGELLGVFLQYNDAPPAGTTDVILSTLGAEPYPATVPFLTVTDAAANGWFRPLMQGCDPTGAPIAGAYEPILLADRVNVRIAGADNGDHIDVWFLVR